MQIILHQSYQTDRSVVALGMFDGVHIGHRVLLERAAALAKRHHAPLVVCTFQEHPQQVIAPEKCPPQLTTFEERCQLMESLGVDVLCAMPFSKETMSMPPEDYVGHLVRRFHPKAVVCGYNHTFGRKGEGTPALLEVLGGALGFETSVVPNITLEGSEVSSSAIRRHLQQGCIAQARKLLARPYARQAQLVSRDGMQCLLRLTDEGKQPLPQGSYRVFCSDKDSAYPAVLHVHSPSEAVCVLPESAPLGTDICLQFWVELSLAF